MMVFFLLCGIFSDVSWILRVFLLKIAWSSCFFGVSLVLFFGVILSIRMSLVVILALIWMMSRSFRLDSILLETFGMFWVIFFGFSLVSWVSILCFLMWIEVSRFCCTTRWLRMIVFL